MKLSTQVFLDLLGVGELLENIKAVAEDRLGLHRRRSHARLAGMTAVVTGGNAGVGFATAEALLRQGAHVVLACRSTQRGQAAAQQLAAVAAQLAGGQAAGDGSAGGRAAPAPPRVEVEALDLASLDSVRRFVRRWQASGRGLDLLVCNAGVMCPPERTLTPDGFELQFQSNYLGHFLLANALVRHARAQRGDAHRPLRVLFLTSMTHWGASLGGASLADAPYCRTAWHSFQAYCNSKLCTLLAAKTLDRRFERDARLRGGSAAAARDSAVAVHPGLVDTALARGYFRQTPPRALRPLTDPFFDRFFCPYLLRSPEAAAETVLFAATAPADQVGGRYCGTAPRVARHSAAADDEVLARRVWELSAHLCDLTADELAA